MCLSALLFLCFCIITGKNLNWLFIFLPSVNMKKNTTYSICFNPTSFLNSVVGLVLPPLLCSSQEMQCLTKTLNVLSLNQMFCFCFAEHTTKCALPWLTTGNRLLFQTSSSAPEQKDQILGTLFQLFLLSPVISSSKSLAHIYKGRPQSSLTKVHTATWNNSPKMLWCTYKGTFVFEVSICTLGDMGKFLYHNGCLQQIISSTLLLWRTGLFPSIFTPSALTTSQPIIMTYTKTFLSEVLTDFWRKVAGLFIQ